MTVATQNLGIVTGLPETWRSPQPRKAIVMFTPTCSGGHARYSWELLTALAENFGDRYRFELVTTEGLDPRFHSDLYTIHQILPPIVDRGTFRSKASWITNRLTYYPSRDHQFLRWLRNRPDVAGVHFQEWPPVLTTFMLGRVRGMGKRIFGTVHNVVPHVWPRLVPRALTRRRIRSSRRMCDGLFVHTKGLEKSLSEQLRGKHPPIHVTPHGIWTVPASMSPAPLGERLAWKRLLFFGALRSNKGLDLMLRAADALPDYSITIAGEPNEPAYFNNVVMPLVNRLRQAGTKINLIDRFVPDELADELFATHSAVVMPYTSGFVAQSGVVYMALAHRVPVVAANVGGLKDLLSKFEIGVGFDGHTPDALAAAVKTLFSSASEERIENQIAQARRWYSWRNTAALTVAGYDAAMSTELVTA